MPNEGQGVAVIILNRGISSMDKVHAPLGLILAAFLIWGTSQNQEL